MQNLRSCLRGFGCSADAYLCELHVSVAWKKLMQLQPVFDRPQRTATLCAGVLWTQRRFFKCISYGVLAIACCLTQARISAADSRLTAPDFALRSIDGKNLRLSEFRGSVVLLNFWAQWCGECRASLATLAELDAKYKRAGLVILSIDLDDDPGGATATAKNLRLPFPVLMDSRKEVGSLYQLESLPFVVLIDRDGNIEFTQAGYKRGDERQWSERVANLLDR